MLSQEVSITREEVISSQKVLLAILEARALPIQSHCRGGVCGVCKCKLKEGSVKYLRDPLGFHQEGEILPCVAIPETEHIVLEI